MECLQNTFASNLVKLTVLSLCRGSRELIRFDCCTLVEGGCNVLVSGEICNTIRWYRSMNHKTTKIANNPFFGLLSVTFGDHSWFKWNEFY